MMPSRKTSIRLLISALIFSAQSVFAVETNEALIQKIREQFQLNVETYDIDILSNRLKTRMVNPVDLSLRPLTQQEPLGLFSLQVEITRDGVIIERGQVRLRIKKFADVLVATDKIEQHQFLGEQQFELKRTDVTSLREQPVVSFAELTGYRAKRNLRMGSILTTGALEPVPDIEVGGEVTIVFSDDWGNITVPGQVLETCRIGDRVRVKNLASGRIVLATV
ncbi:MAG: flagellar basal body P-ring formation chaperone FlgA, partial [candidate division Zixibacteria bacterium]|nr:flagellar basal body P-ring formation chaperone FlgA [candidate division Zixibacteria bacterium]